MWAARFCSVAVLLSPVFVLSPAAAEPGLPDPDGTLDAAISKMRPDALIATAPTDMVAATVPYGEDATELLAHEPFANDSLENDSLEGAASEDHVADFPDALPLMRPIVAAEGLETVIPERQEMAALHLPEAQPLEATVVEPAVLKVAPLKAAALNSTVIDEPLEELAASGEVLEDQSSAGELMEPVDIPSTDLHGQTLVDPLTLIVSLKDQRLDVYRGLERVETTRVSSGMRGYQTLTGVFGILQKKPEHFSNLYDSAPMPWMQRLTRSGTALHAGVVPNRPASHGCVRMPYSFAPKLFRMTDVGGKVAMLTGPMVKPQRIVSPTLVMPASHDESDDVAVEDSVDAGLRAGVLAAVLAPDAKLADKEDAADENDRPWHILVTRREERDIAIGSQQALAAMGYLEPQDNFVGYLGDGTKRAIRAFEKDHGLRPRGQFTEEIAAKIYKAAGKGPLPDAYLFLRKGFSRVAHAPVQLRDPSKPLGTHLFTYVRPSDGGEAGWVGISLEGEDSTSVLDRITIPDDMQDQIAEGLTSGASFIVADIGKHSSVLPEGDDFIVRTNDSAASNVVAEKAKAQRRKYAAPKQRAAPKKRVARTQTQRRRTAVKPKTTVRRTVSAPRGFKLFGRR